jgi:hypothetical protein
VLKQPSVAINANRLLSVIPFCFYDSSQQTVGMSVDISPLDCVRHATYHKRYYIAAHIEIEAFSLMFTIVTEELLDLEMTRKVS